MIDGWATGVWIMSDGNALLGNYIGTDASGEVAVPNLQYGVEVQGSANTIGGSSAGAGNVISGNGSAGLPGIVISGYDDNLVQGNFIGTDVTGEHALGNSGDGVQIFGSENTIGGTTAGDRNVISGNGVSGFGVGVYIQNSGVASSGNVLAGNFIGTDATGTVAVRNQGLGILLESVGGPVSSNTIGGTTAGAGNLISGNGSDQGIILGSGVELDGNGVTNNLVAGNFIGTDRTGSAALGNAGSGIVFYNGASKNTVGGAAAGAGNVIAYNVEGVFDDVGNDNGILGNAIYADALGSIVLSSGANDNQQAPTVASVTSINGVLIIAGSLQTPLMKPSVLSSLPAPRTVQLKKVRLTLVP